MRIGLVGEQWVTARPGGMNRYVAGLHHALGHLGADVTTFCLGSGHETLPPGVVRVGSPASGSARRMLAFRRAIRHAGPFDIIDCHFAPYAIGALRRPRAGARVVHFHGPWAEESRIEGASRAVVLQRLLIERVAYRLADLHICDSEAFTEVLRDRYGVPGDSTRVITPGLDLDQWVPGDRLSERRRLGLDPDDFVVVVVRRLVRRMGHRVLFEAWRSIARNHPGAVLAVIGEGPLIDELDAAAVDVGGDIRFAGRVSDDELRRWYVASDLQVVPSTAWEGFGLIVLEALGCGRPSLVSDVGGLPALTRQLDDRLVVPAGERGALTRRLDEILGGRVELPDEAACRALAEAHSWTRVARTHLDFYGDLLAASR